MGRTARIFEALGYRGFVLSDYNRGVEDEFGNVVAFTRGYEDLWAKIVELLADKARRLRCADEGYRRVPAHQSMDEGAAWVVKYLKQLCG